MADLPARPDLDQLRHQAKELLRAAQHGDPEATARIRAVTGKIILSSAQLALAREYGFASWAKLKLEVERRDVLNSRDLSRLASLLAEHPELATSQMEHWCDHKLGAHPLGYMAMLRFDRDRLGLPGELPGTGAVARVLIDAGAPVNGRPEDFETPLITAASYGDAEVAQVLIDAGADIEAVSAPDGGVPSATALVHAAVFGMTDVVDVLVAAGAKIRSLEQAAAAGDITRWPLGRFTLQSRLRALVFAADHQRLEVIDQLIEAGTPVNQPDAEFGRLPLHTAAGNGRAASVRELLAHDADPNLRDPRHHRTPLEECQKSDSPGHHEVEATLRPLTQHDTRPPAS
jgi:ankyrin repeat protein